MNSNTFPKDLPNVKRLTLAVATESAEDLSPIISAVAKAKAKWDIELGPGGALASGGALATVLDAAGYTVPDGTGTALYTDIATLRSELPAPLNTTNAEGNQNINQATEVQLGNIRGYYDYFNCLRLPVSNDPALPGDDDSVAINLLLTGIQLVYDMHETLTSRRGFSVPS